MQAWNETRRDLRDSVRSTPALAVEVESKVIKKRQAAPKPVVKASKLVIETPSRPPPRIFGPVTSILMGKINGGSKEHFVQEKAKRCQERLISEENFFTLVQKGIPYHDPSDNVAHAALFANVDPVPSITTSEPPAKRQKTFEVVELG
ncbi:hypothetical protein Slin15195_G051170 [Septoria linicola]|uniref:Uncharacterized protein n=1 Tax=Septoria linicola TaxID=215465 RepID=A0A9Q9EJW9_9PEZI|nr:hypothetical protein Slin15195_G051170 [Septoria linicola]